MLTIASRRSDLFFFLYESPVLLVFRVCFYSSLFSLFIFRLYSLLCIYVCVFLCTKSLCALLYSPSFLFAKFICCFVEITSTGARVLPYNHFTSQLIAWCYEKPGLFTRPSLLVSVNRTSPDSPAFYGVISPLKHQHFDGR